MGETPFRFECEGASLLGVLHAAEQPAELGVLMMVGGGPQYRAGGHRQLTLWARALARQGIPVMRFDYRGVGDSGGSFLGFEHVEADLRAAIAAFFERQPKLRGLILWGECDASSAIMMHAYKEPRVVGLCLQNPWARTPAAQAKAYIKHYYLHRLTERTFWRKVLRFEFNPLAAGFSFLQNAYRARRSSPGPGEPRDQSLNYIERMKNGLKAYKGDVLLHMSGRDLMAREFDDLVASNPEWAGLIKKSSVQRIDLPLADHTFSSAAMRQVVIDSASEWINGIRAAAQPAR